MESSDVNLKNWKSLIKPSKIDIDQNDEKTFAKVTAEPLEKGYGLTIGNSSKKNFIIIYKRCSSNSYTNRWCTT